MPIIRPVRPEELDEIFAMVRRAVIHMNAAGNPQWGDDYPTRVHYAQDIVWGELYGAFSPAGALLGVACINTRQAPEYAAVAWRVPAPAVVIHRMAVDPDHQRHGVGHTFFHYAQALAHSRGVPALHVDTYGKNVRMQALILSCGFTQMGEINLHGRPLKYPCFEKVLG